MADVVTSLEQVTTDWLTGVLTKSGALEAGIVAMYEVDTDERLLSTSVRLRLTYSPGAKGQQPQKLFLKMVNTNQDDEFFGASEVNYYTRDYIGVADVPLLRVYDAAYSDEMERYHILMDDMMDTHVPAYEKVPTLEHGLAFAEAFAVMHAHWWGQKRLADGNEPIPDAVKINRFVEIARPGAKHIIDGCADQLKTHWADTIYELLEKHPSAMLERTKNGNGFTLIHGDPNLANILVPREGTRPIFIIDRQPFDWSLTTWLGAYDLAYTMVLKWDSDIRRQLEEPVLQHYHEHLLQRGVEAYSWEQLRDDYRLSVGICVYVAIEWCRGQLNRDTMQYWLPMLQRSMTAIDDLNCADLWK